MQNIFTDYVNAWLLWGKNQVVHVWMAEAWSRTYMST